MKNKIYQGNNIDIMKTFPDNCIDTIITDPPYGIAFMSKKWDYDVPSVETWKECLRVLKPGGTALIFAGSRTQHRMAVNVEDAGFQLKDCILWIYGSGFPKATDISKRLDKLGGKSIGWFGQWLKNWRKTKNISQKEITKLFPSKTGGLTGCVSNWELGFNSPTAKQFTKICTEFNLPFKSIKEAERNIIGSKETNLTVMQNIGEDNISGKINITEPATDEAKIWDGWKSHGLKPAYEIVICAEKPIDNLDHRVIIDKNLSQLEAKLWLLLSAKTVKKLINTALNVQKLVNIAQWDVEKCINIKEDLSGQMDTFQFDEMVKTFLSTVILWRQSLRELWTDTNTSTIKMETSQIIDWEILRSLLLENTHLSIIEVEIKRHGFWLNASPVAKILNVVKKNMHVIQELSVVENVISSQLIKPQDVAGKTLSPAYEPLIVCMKPNEGTYANNALKWGVSGLNIDGGRIGDEKLQYRTTSYKDANTGEFSNQNKINYTTGNKIVEGRYPANLILDEEAGKMLDEQTGSTGGPSRFFYCAKASKAERNKGLSGEKKNVSHDGRDKHIENPYQRHENKQVNNHPTIKPLKLMEYLCTLTKTPTGGLVLDPFAGSGTTGLACINTGRDYILIERESEYIDIIKARVKEAKSQL